MKRPDAQQLSPTTSDRQPQRFLSERETIAVAGFGSRSAFRKEVKAQRFPSPVRISSGRIAWPECDIAKWQAKKIADRDGASQSAASSEASGAVGRGPC